MKRLPTFAFWTRQSKQPKACTEFRSRRVRGSGGGGASLSKRFKQVACIPWGTRGQHFRFLTLLLSHRLRGCGFFCVEAEAVSAPVQRSRLPIQPGRNPTVGHRHLGTSCRRLSFLKFAVETLRFEPGYELGQPRFQAVSMGAECLALLGTEYLANPPPRPRFFGGVPVP